MRILLHLIVYDILLASVHLCLDVFLVYSYFTEDDPWWAGVTLTAVCLPGLLEMMVILYMYLHGNLPGTNYQQLKEFLFWALLFGPLLFPVSLIMWHSYQLYKGEKNFLKFENLARSRVLNSLSVLTKSALQLVLQTSIIMITWSTEHDVWLRLYRIGSIVMSLLVIANAATGHHYFVSSGKDTHAEKQVKLSRRLSRLMFNITHVLIRGFVISLLAGYLQFLILIFIFLMIVSNYTLARLTVKSNDTSKHLLTAFGSVLLPKCFVSRDTLQDKPPHYGAKMFERFYRFNAVVFFIVFSVLGLVTAVCIIRLTEVSQFTCENLPFLSDDLKCSLDSSSDISHWSISHGLFYWAGSLLIVLSSAVHVILVLLQESVIRDNRHTETV